MVDTYGKIKYAKKRYGRYGEKIYIYRSIDIRYLQLNTFNYEGSKAVERQ